ncbi:hypothetical protein HMPREF3201_00137 [Megasphaera sp. MJR8396C]|nr:hypothetical protein HMPREF3201_00137 [Megasphaera sp. MJR8396C]
MAFLIGFKNYPIAGIAILYEIHRPIARKEAPYTERDPAHLRRALFLALRFYKNILFAGRYDKFPLSLIYR